MASRLQVKSATRSSAIALSFSALERQAWTRASFCGGGGDGGGGFGGQVDVDEGRKEIP